MADKRLSNIQGGWNCAGVVMGDSVFLYLAGRLGVKFGERDCLSKSFGGKKCFWSCMFACLHDSVLEWRMNCLIVLSLHFPPHTHTHTHTHPHLPHHSDSWKQNSSDSFCCFSLSKLPHSPHRSPVPLTVVIGSAGIIQRLDIIYCLPCTIPPPTLTPFLNRTRCPADELIILEILFLLLIPPFYEPLLFMVQWI